MKDLNPQQQSAVKAVNGHVLILAGAGSGKTRVLTLRMAHLICDHGVSPESVLGLTFTNKAATEMGGRLAMLIPPAQAKKVTLSTFHSFCMHILRAEIEHLGYTRHFTLYDENDIQRLINAIARDLLEHEGELPSLSVTTESIAMARNKGLKYDQISGTGSTWHDTFTQELFRRLQNSMRAYNVVDFDSLLTLTVELFQSKPEVLEKYQDRFRYIMIDEYQDTNPVQYQLASLLSAKYGNLCVVGDDDQSIYGWRGADIQNILNFPYQTLITLEQNYRSTNTILKAANALIGNNQKRHGKQLWSSRGEGTPIEIFHAPDELKEAEAVVFKMDTLRLAENLTWKDIAILYRSNAMARPIEMALLKYTWKNGTEWIRGIPYKIYGGTEFYERREVKDILAYLRVIVNPMDQEALLRIINHPRRGIGESTLDLLTAYNRTEKISLWDTLKGVIGTDAGYSHLRSQVDKKALKGLCIFTETLTEAKEKFHTQPAREVLHWLVEKIQYQKAIDEEVKSTQMRAFKWENVQQFLISIEEYAQFHQEKKTPFDIISTFVLEMPLERSRDFNHTSKENQVSLMTFHSAKGLEFPACFLVGIEDHIIPHEKSAKEGGIEEERRLMYVAMTRAMQKLTISMATQRKRMGTDAASAPSRFLLEIPKDYLRPVAWDR